MIAKTFPITGKLIKNGLILTQQLYQKLLEEADSLKENKQAELIAQIATQKQGLVHQINQFTEQLGKILATEKTPNNSAGIYEYFVIARNAGFDTDEITLHWSQLSDLSEKCRFLNQQNGASIELLSRHVQRSLQLIKGKPDTVNTYGPDGSTKNDLYSHTQISV